MKKVVILFIIMFFISGCSVKKTDNVTDAEIFASEYAISKDNVFTYASIDEVLELFESGTGIVFFGNSDQDYLSDLVKIFSDLVEKKNISKVYYYNPVSIKNNEEDSYNQLINLLGDNLTIDDNGDGYLAVPSIYFVKNGKIVGYNDDALKMYDIDDEDDLEKFKNDYSENCLLLIEKFIRE